MERTQVVIPAADMERQREFTDKIAAIHASQNRRPKAFVDTYGCQQNVADSQRIMGMLRDMGCDLTGERGQSLVFWRALW